uniref:Uncharacterized protein n=1 Tax=Fagus sylvatica TaxID=28930 RepID=A0A2N9F3J5_FAGSY
MSAVSFWIRQCHHRLMIWQVVVIDVDGTDDLLPVKLVEFAKFISVVPSSISMAATIPPFSLLRNYAATTARAFVTLKPSYTISSTRLLLPLPSRRLQFYASATNNEEAASRAAAANADSGAPTMYHPL